MAENTYAVIRIKGFQYKVKRGEEILVPRLKESELTPEVLLLVKDSVPKIGKPNISDVKVKFKILGEKPGKKIRVLKFKAKSRYRRVRGFTPQYTRLLIEDIS